MKKTILVLAAMVGLHLAYLAQDSIAEMEYWVDEDPGLGNAIAIEGFTPAEEIIAHVYTQENNLSIGTHIIGTRAKDNSGAWSHTAFSRIEIVAPPINPSVQAGEYWINEDPGLGNATAMSAITPASLVQNWASTLSIPSAIGTHLIGYRVLDDQGRWSHTNFGRVRIVAIPDETKAIAAVEFYWDVDEGHADNIVIPLGSPINPLLMADFDVPVPNEFSPLESHHLFVRTIDTDGKWSHTYKMPEQIDIYTIGDVFTNETIYSCGPYNNSGIFITEDTTLESYEVNGAFLDTYITEVLIVNSNLDVDNSMGTLTVAQENASYQWIDCDLNMEISGANNQSYMPSSSGNYQVEVSIENPDGSNCVTLSECIDTTIETGETFTTALLGCESVTLSGIVYTSDTTITQVLIEDGVQNTYINEIDIVADFEVNVEEGVDLSTPTLDGYSYQWFDCSSGSPLAIADATASNFSPTVSGSYSVEVTVSAGDETCVAMSDCSPFSISVAEHGEDGLQINLYPNPTQNWLKYTYSGTGQSQLRIYTMQGTLVSFAQNVPTSGMLNLEHLATGTYLFELKNSSLTDRKKFVKF